MEKRPTDEQLAKYRKNAQDQSLSAEVRAKFQAVVDKFSAEIKELEGEKPKSTRGRKPSATAKKSTASKTKKSADDIETAKAEIKRKTGKTEEECESIIEQYRALRTKAQEGRRKAEQASAENKKRVQKLDKKGDLIEGTSEKTADAVIESATKDVAEKIEKQIEAVEEKAEKEAKAEVAKDKNLKTPKAKKEAVEAKVEKKVAEKTKTIVKRVVIDTSELLSSIATSLGKFDKDSQKEFLIKLRSDIDKLLSKYAFGGMTDGATQVMNIQQSNLSSSSVNPSQFAKGGGVDDKIKVTKLDKVVQHYDGKTWELDKYPAYTGGSAKEWINKYPLDLEDAKALVFELAGDEAYDYEDEINDAKDFDELKEILWENDFKNYQRDNTYNQSWWGGAVEWSALTENGDAYDRALVFVELHQGGDVRGNYGETKAFELEPLADEFPPYLARLTYYLDTPEGTLSLDTEDMEGYTLVVVEDETGTYEEGDYVTLDELEDQFDLDGKSLYAKGGLTEHGLRENDKIIGSVKSNKDEIYIVDGKRKAHIVNLDKGKRYSKGGGIAYKSAIQEFNSKLISHPSVTKFAKHYNKTPQEIVRVLQPRISTKSNRNKLTTEVYIDYTDKDSGLSVKHKEKFVKGGGVGSMLRNRRGQ